MTRVDSIPHPPGLYTIKRAEKEHLAHGHENGNQAVPGPGGAEEDHSLHLWIRPGSVAKKGERQEEEEYLKVVEEPFES